MEKLLLNKVALVTGGSKGIGHAIVTEFVQRGARTIYLSRTQTPDHDFLQTLAAENGGSIKWIHCDISDEKSIEKAISNFIDSEKDIDILVNNAGITCDRLAIRMNLDDWNKVLTTNLTSTFLITRSLLRLMIQNKKGSIINVSSVVGIHGNGGQTNYAASKAGLIGYSKSLAKEVASRGIRVNIVAPGFIETDMTEKISKAGRELLINSIPLCRTGKPEEVAKTVVFLASEMASYITGEVIKIDGGMTI